MTDRARRPADLARRCSTPLLARRRPHRRATTAWAMEQVMLGEATPVQIAGFVVALRAKGEAPDEVDRPGPRDARRTA